jgi:hypothetical protein
MSLVFPGYHVSLESGVVPSRTNMDSLTFRTRASSDNTLQNLLFGIVYYSQLYYLLLFFQNVHHLTPLISAVLLLPLTGAQMAASNNAGLYISWRERYGEVIWVGFVFQTLGFGLTCAFDVDTPK